MKDAYFHSLPGNRKFHCVKFAILYNLSLSSRNEDGRSLSMVYAGQFYVSS